MSPIRTANADLLLDAAVTVDKPEAGKQHVKIVWRVRRKDGSEIGTVAQENDVPAGLLDGAWGDVAYTVAVGGAGRHPAADRPRRPAIGRKLLNAGVGTRDRRVSREVVRSSRGLLHYRCTKPRGSARRRAGMLPPS